MGVNLSPTTEMQFFPITILLYLIIGWLAISYFFKLPSGKINRGYTIQKKTIKTAHLHYLIGLEDGIIQPAQKVKFYSVTKPGFIIKRNNEILIYSGSTIVRGGRFVTPIGYINLEQLKPVLEIRLWISAKWLIIVLLAKILLVDVVSIFPSVIFTIFFAITCIIYFFVETSEIENFLDKQAKSASESNRRKNFY